MNIVLKVLSVHNFITNFVQNRAQMCLKPVFKRGENYCRYNLECRNGCSYMRPLH